ncbi:hypothetical protein EYF80_063839 [Liparis tanakae]|uniref:Uncharacterized protein n=1 Tax=Liparis tanakae TaxID=230148 RepID=A0A4Z2EAW8_9TELE|nr:hypothetical protein EYF80_063839 [Liparis tanakae]
MKTIRLLFLLDLKQEKQHERILTRRPHDVTTSERRASQSRRQYLLPPQGGSVLLDSLTFCTASILPPSLCSCELIGAMSRGQLSEEEREEGGRSEAEECEECESSRAATLKPDRGTVSWSRRQPDPPTRPDSSTCARAPEEEEEEESTGVLTMVRSQSYIQARRCQSLSSETFRLSSLIA